MNVFRCLFIIERRFSLYKPIFSTKKRFKNPQNRVPRENRTRTYQSLNVVKRGSPTYADNSSPCLRGSKGGGIGYVRLGRVSRQRNTELYDRF